MLAYIITATTIIGFISLIGVFILFKKDIREHIIKTLISVAAGSLLAVSFTDLLPEAIENSQGVFKPRTIMLMALGSFLLFFVLERVLHWHHCRCGHGDHQKNKTKKHLVYFNLAGDSLHNIIDGFLVAGAFLLDVQTGLIVTIAVILHEIPQEISDFGVLVYAGLTKTKAIFYNLTIASLAVFSSIIFYFFGSSFEQFIPLMAAFAAGNFLYLAAADLIPELHKEQNSSKVVYHTFWLLLGVLVIYLAGRILPHIV